MNLILFLVQLVLLVLWYAVPAMAHIPAMIIFIPLMGVALSWVLLFGFLVLAFIFAVLCGR